MQQSQQQDAVLSQILLRALRQTLASQLPLCPPAAEPTIQSPLANIETSLNVSNIASVAPTLGVDTNSLNVLVQALSASILPSGPLLNPISIPSTHSAAILPSSMPITPSVFDAVEFPPPPVDATKLLLRNLSLQSTMLQTLQQEMREEEKQAHRLKSQKRTHEAEANRLKQSVQDLEEKLKAEQIKFEEAESKWREMDAVHQSAIRRLESKKIAIADLEKVVTGLKDDVRRETGFDPEKLVSSVTPVSLPKDDADVDSFLTQVVGTDASSKSQVQNESAGGAQKAANSEKPRIKIIERSSCLTDSMQSSPSSLRSGNTDARNSTDAERRRSIHSTDFGQQAGNSAEPNEKSGVAITIFFPHSLVMPIPTEHLCDMEYVFASHKLPFILSKGTPICPHPVEQGLEFCFAFNAWGVCRFHQGGECSRAHFCMRCMSEDHAGFKCPMNMAEYPLASTRMSDASGAGRDDRDRGAKERERDRERTRDRDRQREKEKRERERERDRDRGSEKRRSSDDQGNDCHEKRAKYEEEVRNHNATRGKAQSPISTTPSRTKINSKNPIAEDEKGDVTAAVVNSDLSETGAKLTVTPAVPILSNSERGIICRDFNNGKCGLDKCRFKHVCLRCGDSSHQEKRCPHGAAA
ncbi:hypothetical protein HDU82_008234 [Entophlyctis luteolus]|nr:hypothetical protein HDU82_008234 [Entophlyctis luteolus]